MRRLLLTGLAVAFLVGPTLAHAAPGERPSRPSAVVERAVAFEIVNQNRSATSGLCSGDGGRYTMRGALLGPPGVQTGSVDAMTLYVHGSGDASTWHFTAVPDHDHVAEMARLGHASVFVHLLGYGPSDPVDGANVCLGAYADHVHQVIEHLRQGSYSMAGRSAPSFDRIALAGHSSGALIAQLSTVSFHSADALVAAGWTDYAWGATLAEDLDPPGPFSYGALAGFAQRCATDPQAKQPDGPGNWAYLFTTQGEFDMLVHDVAPDVWAAFVDLYEQDPCGWGDDMFGALTANISRAPTVAVPVLVTAGDRDPVAPPASLELQRARYELGSDDVSSLLVPETAHQIMLERRAPVFRAALSEWLRARGF